MKLRPYQEEVEAAVYAEWDGGARNVCAVLPTGAGKTVLFTKIMKDHGAAIAIAHRQELVSQMSVTLGRHGVRHSIIAPLPTIKDIVSKHMRELGKVWYDSRGACCVAGVDTLIRRDGDYSKIKLWVGDECHHFQGGSKPNKWGKAAELFPNARGLGVTATPERADGRGLGSHNTGVFDALVVGPSMRELIRSGSLTEYRIFAPPNNLDMSGVKITATGDFSRDGACKAVRKSKVIGNVVEHYVKYAAGKLGVTFATDVETATEISSRFNAAGVPSEVISAKTKDSVRSAILEKFTRREIMQLVNVDLFGEGFDLPKLEVVSMARPTQSYGLYVQQFGRPLRPLASDPGKIAMIIDHVGNVQRHGLPDAPRTWSLDAREKRGSAQTVGSIPVKVCPQCTGVFEALFRECPYCGFYAEPAGRDSIEFVDGDLTELDAATLAAMRGELAHFDRDKEEYRAELLAKHADPMHAAAHVKRHVAKQTTQKQLREALAWWVGFERAGGLKDREISKKFYFKFGTDVMSAKTLNINDAEALRMLICKNMEITV